MTDNTLSRRAVLGGLIAAATGAGASAAARTPKAARARPPNIVFFLGEGLRYDEFSFRGNPLLKTPNMDRLAREGALFRNAFVTNALCLPSRASFLTGAYSHTTGATTNEDNQVPARFPLVSDVLREQRLRDRPSWANPMSAAPCWITSGTTTSASRGQADYLNPEVVEGSNGQLRRT